VERNTSASKRAVGQGRDQWSVDEASAKTEAVPLVEALAMAMTKPSAKYWTRLLHKPFVNVLAMAKAWHWPWLILANILAKQLAAAGNQTSALTILLFNFKQLSKACLAQGNLVIREAFMW
jgi:hypothetical protein